jgi:outer membrane autotransporter protein
VSLGGALGYGTAATHTLFAEISAVSVNPQLKAVSEGALAGLPLINQGADLVAGLGMESVTACAERAMRATGKDYCVFGIVSGGSLRYETGSHVDMHSLSAMTGLAKNIELAPGNLTFGTFFEYGDGSYDTHNRFSNAASIRGNGDARYAGGGVLTRLDFTPTDPGRFYLEASVRAGRLYNDYRNPDMHDEFGRETGFEIAVPYVGLHTGAGYLLSLPNETSLEFYGKYFWTRQEGKSTHLRTHEPIRFDTTDSHRVRTGMRFSRTLTENFNGYFGIAVEHEFDAEARAKVYHDHAIEKAKLTGGTGIGEIGLSLKPSSSLPLSIDLGVQGYTGKREGVTGSLQVKVEF